MASQTKPRASKPPKPDLVIGVGETSKEAILDAFPAPPAPPAEPADPRMRTHKVNVGDGHVNLGIIVH